MRTTMSIGALALLLAATSAHARPPRDDQGPRPAPGDSTFRGRRGPGGPGGPGGPERMLLRGITLSDAQQKRVAALHESRRETMDRQRDAGREALDEVRAARERGDSAAASRAMARARGDMERRRDEEVKSLRAILTADQRRQFDANVAEMKQHDGERERGERGERGFGRGPRDGR